MITTFYPPYHTGGDAVYVQALAGALADRGHAVDVVHCGDAFRLLHGRPAQPAVPRPGVTVHRLKSRLGRLSPLLTQQTGRPGPKAPALRRILAGGFDVIHFHNVSLVGGPGVLAMGTGIKLYTAHEYWMLCPTHTLFKDNREPCVQPACVRCQLRYRRPPQLWRRGRWLERATQHLDVLLCPSEFAAQLHRDRLPASLPIEHLPHFVAPAAAVAGAAAEQEPFFLFVGRLEKLKGLQTVIPLFRRRPDLHLRIAGKGTYESALRALAGDAPNIAFVGHVTGAELDALYRGATALVVPSVCYEVLGLVILEAFRHGTPAVVRDRGGMPELVANSGGGLVFDDETKLEAALDRIARDPALRSALGDAGRDTLGRHWTADRHIERYLEIIEAAAARKRRAMPRQPT